jgi:FG-GAP-like repeat
MRPPHAEVPRRGFRGRLAGRSIVPLVCIGVALVLGAVARSAPGHVPTFAAAKSYATGKGPNLVVADLNGDRRFDLVAANRYSRTLSVLLNKGHGTFAAKRDYAVGGHPDGVEVADLNGDGSPDLATGNELPTTFSVLLNRGDGSFEAKRDYESPDELAAVADLNGDRRPDLVGTREGDVTKTLSVLLNRVTAPSTPIATIRPDEISPLSRSPT